MRPILMCEPNISEGRDLEAIEQVTTATQSVSSVRLLDRSTDPDHHRTVFTYLGEPEAVLAATQALAARAWELIDMAHHHGSHPRQGAVDVVPFIPLRDLTMTEAVSIARRFGQWAGARGVPVYYYEEAANRPERASLPAIRKGEYEALPSKLQDPAWAPDEGPAVFNARTGAMVTGARMPLVAFNVNLRTTEIAIAERIVRAVRHVSGGYRYVRALAVPLKEKGLVQVSMNLVNYQKTPIHRVFETVQSEAARHGVSVAATELVGPVPLAALEEVVRHYLQNHGFGLGQVIETGLLDECWPEPSD